MVKIIFFIPLDNYIHGIMGGRKDIIWDLCQTTFGGTLSTRVQMKNDARIVTIFKNS